MKENAVPWYLLCAYVKNSKALACAWKSGPYTIEI